MKILLWFFWIVFSLSLAISVTMAILTFIRWCSRVVAEGVLDFVDCYDLIGPNPQLHYFFTKPYLYSESPDGHPIEFRSSLIVPMSMRDPRDTYVPKAGDNLRVTLRENIFRQPLNFSIEKMPSPDS